ncbi:carboxylate-amine ligase [Nocardioides sp.]|uniref:carboxylate-amine ligase n=1 Tax=Nocardioides sp. TaxID=35761 RepID=UPI002ED2AA9C
MSGGVRKVGVEEELLLVDPATGELRALSRRVLHEHRASTAGRRDEAFTDLDEELLQHMVETRTAPDTELAKIGDQLRAARRTAIDAATAAGAAVAAVGTAPLVPADPPLSESPRYQRIGQQFGRLGRTSGTFGMHVHVDIASDEEAVRTIDGLRPWLPVVVAVAANSPYADNADTGYASWRQQVWTRWPSAGPTEPFGTLAEYRRVTAALIESGAALDRGMLYFDARPAEKFPTVEVRVADVCTDVEDALLVAALCRALVETVADQEPQTPAIRSDLLRAAHWRAARFGTAGDLAHPLTGGLAPAREVVETLVAAVAPALDAAGDRELVEAGVERVVAGTGATHQRQAFETGGDLTAVVRDAVERTEAAAL